MKKARFGLVTAALATGLFVGLGTFAALGGFDDGDVQEAPSRAVTSFQFQDFENEMEYGSVVQRSPDSIVVSDESNDWEFLGSTRPVSTAGDEEALTS